MSHLVDGKKITKSENEREISNLSFYLPSTKIATVTLILVQSGRVALLLKGIVIIFNIKICFIVTIFNLRVEQIIKS